MIKANPTREFFVNMLVRDILLKQAIIELMYMVNNSSSRKRYASPKAGTELYLDLVFRQ